MLSVVSVGQLALKLERGRSDIKTQGKVLKHQSSLMLFTVLQLGNPTWYMAICVFVFLQGLLKFQLTSQPTWEFFLTLYDSQRSTLKFSLSSSFYFF